MPGLLLLLEKVYLLMLPKIRRRDEWVRNEGKDCPGFFEFTSAVF